MLSPEICESGVDLDIIVLADRMGLGAVQLGHFHCLIFLKLLGKLIPGGGQLLTVAAPRGIKLDESVSG